MKTDSQAAHPALDTAACWEVLRRVAASPALKRAARLRDFLEWMGTQALTEGRVEAHEQEIGHAVFARNEGYDTTQDNIVRVSASELRKRVDAYFANEGKDEMLIFEIPRGSYLPQFRWRAKTAEPGGEPVDAGSASAAVRPGPWAEVTRPEPRPSGRQRLVLVLVLVLVSILALGLAIACATLWRQNQELRQQMQHLEQPAPAPSS